MCLAAFASLHGITQSRVRRLASATLSSVHAPVDMCGKHRNRPRMISGAVKKQIDEHIRSLPAMKTHYSRGKNSYQRKYLLKCMIIVLRSMRLMKNVRLCPITNIL